MKRTIPCTIAPGGKAPVYCSSRSAGADIHALVDEPVTIRPGRRSLIPTGLRLQIPAGYEGQVRPRSGLAAKFGVTVLNTPGTIDSDYRGEVMVVLINLGTEPFIVRNGERIAQLVIAPVEQAEFEAAVELELTARGKGGFGSTGT